MPNQEESRDGKTHVDRSRPSPDVERYATDGQSNARGKGPTDEQGQRLAPAAGAAQSASDPSGAGSLNLDDQSEDHPRGDTRRTGGTWVTPPHNTGDQGAVGPAPGAGLSNTNGPSDPGIRGERRER